MKTTLLLRTVVVRTTLALLGATPFFSQAALPPLQLSISTPASSNEFTRSVELSWDGAADMSYQIQSTADLGNPSAWKTEDLVKPTSVGPVRWMAPESIRDRRYYQLVAHPQISSVEPTFIDASDTSAVLYLLGQLLPTNATVIVNGHSIVPEIVNSNGVWARISLNGLPPGEPVLGTLVVIENGTSNVVATLPVQSPIVYGTAMTTEQLQGPPDDYPPLFHKITKSRSNIQNNRLIGGGDDDCDDGDPGIAVGYMKITKSRSNIQNNRHRATTADPYPDPPNCCRIMSGTGELRCQETDLAYSGLGFDFVWTRTYNSRIGTGNGWDFSYNVSLTPQSDGTMLLRSGNGRADTFYPNGTNGWSRDEYFAEVRDLDGDGMPDVLFADGSKWFFHPMDGSPVAGKIERFCDKNENCDRCRYDALGRLIQVVDSLDRTNTVAYNSTGLIESVTDFSGRTARYEYDAHGDLVACVSPPMTGTPTGNDFPGGITNRYTYTSGNVDERLNHNLTSCTDGRGQTWLMVSYQPTNNPSSIDFDAVDFFVRDGHVEHLRRYPQTPSSANGFAKVKVTVRDAMGNVSEGFYDSRLRCVRLLEYTGRASDLNAPTTEANNRPKNKLRPEDPDFFETKWVWNPDALCTLVARADGGSTRCVYERDYDSSVSARKKGDLRVLREMACCSGADVDGDGLDETTELAWHFDYDPRFGSPPDILNNALRNMRTRINELEAHLPNLGLLGRFGSGPRQTTSQDGTFSHRKGWDGTIKGSPRIDDDGFSTKFDGDKTPIVRGSALGGLGRKGWDGTIKGSGAKIYNPTREYLAGDTVIYNGKAYRPGRPVFGNITFEGFMTSAIDPRGNAATASYDENGNLKSTVPLPVITIIPPAVVNFAYNSHGQLTAVTNAPDGNGYRRVDTIEYETSGADIGRARKFIVDVGGVVKTFKCDYDARGNIVRLTDGRTNDTLYVYNELDQLVRYQSPTNLIDRCTTDFAYDANGTVVMSSVEYRDGQDSLTHKRVKWNNHNPSDGLVEIVDQVDAAHFVTNRFGYDGNGNLVTVSSPMAVSGADPNSVTRFEYDERNLVFREITPSVGGESLTNECSYSATRDLTKSALKVALKLSKGGTYDGFGRLVSVTDPMSNAVSYVYDRNGNLTGAKFYGETNDVPGDAHNQLLASVHYEYDGLNRLTRTHWDFFDITYLTAIGDGSATTTFSYAPNGDCLSVTDDNGHTTRFAYDTAGRLASVTDAKTNVFAYTYDGSDNVVAVTETDRSDLTPALQVFSKTYVYDNLDRLVSNADNVGNTLRYTYDSFGQVVSSTDPRSNMTFYAYDDLGRRTLAVADLDRDGIADLAVDVNQSWTYDDNSRCTSATDDNTNTTHYFYDSRGRTIETSNPDGTSCSLVWSPRSNLLRQQDANGNVISNSFDLLDRCVLRQITVGSTVVPTTTFEEFAYDAMSRLTMASNDVSRTEYSYDSMGNRVRAGVSGPGAGVASYVHDGVGNCIGIFYPSGLAVGYTYDGLDQVSTVRRCEGCGNPWLGDISASFAYEGPGRLGRINRTNNINTRIVWDGTVSPPNTAGDFGWQKVTGINHQVAGGGTVIDRRATLHDESQNKVLRAQVTPFYVGGDTRTNSFQYDPLDRLSRAINTKGTGTTLRTYVLDGNGNRKMVLSGGGPDFYAMDSAIPGPMDFQMNQYTATPYGALAYDDNGNQVSSFSASGQLQYQYDYANRLVAVTDLTSGVPAPVASYSYDALGRRLTKTVYPSAPLSPITTEYVHGDDGPDDCDDRDPKILEVRTGTLIDSYVHKLDDGVTVYSVRAGALPRFYHEDEQGNVLALTDAGGGVIERYDYDDYGLPSFLTIDGFPMAVNSSPVGNPFLFHGMEWDGETSLYFGHSRGATSGPFNARDGRYLIRAGIPLRFDGTDRTFENDNPWSAKTTKDKCFGAGQPHPQSCDRERLKDHFANGDIPNGNDLSSVIVVDDRAPTPRNSPPKMSGKLARPVLKSFFQTGDKPTQAQFGALIDSMVNYHDDRDFIGMKFQHRQEYGQTLPEKRKQ